MERNGSLREDYKNISSDKKEQRVQNHDDGIKGSYNSCDQKDHISNDNGRGEVVSLPSTSSSAAKSGLSISPGELEKAPQDEEEEAPISPFKDKYAPQFFAAFAANFGAFALGTVLSWTAPALPDLRASKSIGEITDAEETWISSIALLGAASSCPIIGLLMERFGRRQTLLFITTPFLIGWLIITFAQNVWMMYAGRFLTGFCGGACSIVVPVYITETSSVKIRGMLASGFDMFITIGILYIFVIGTYFNWQIQAVACGAIPIVFHILVLFTPESPRYLVEKGNFGDASKALCWLRGASSPAHVQAEMNELMDSVEESRRRSSCSWRDLIRDRSLLKPTLIGVLLMCFQMLSAIDAIMFYTVDIFHEAGTDIDENLSANIVGAVQVLATVTAAVLVDHCGRRFLLLASEIGMVISLSGMGTFFYLKMKYNPEETGVFLEHLGWLPLASLMLFCIAFSVGMGPLPWLLMGELLPPSVKGIASGTVTITRWVMGFVVTMLFKNVMGALGMHGGYWLFAGFCVAGTVFVYFYVPETKGVGLDEIQQFFKHDDDDKRRDGNETGDIGDVGVTGSKDAIL